MVRAAVVVVAGSLALGTFTQPAYAADATDPAPGGAPAIVLDAPEVLAPTVTRSLTLTLTRTAPLHRPPALPALYAGLAATQAFDVYSTRRGLASGAHETNPLLQGGSPAFWTLKAVGTVAPIVIAERMWKTHKTAAIVTMVLANGVMAAVAANNARVLHQQR